MSKRRSCPVHFREKNPVVFSVGNSQPPTLQAVIPTSIQERFHLTPLNRRERRIRAAQARQALSADERHLQLALYLDEVG